MPFKKALIQLIGWVLFLGIANYLATYAYPADGFTLKFSWITYFIFSFLTLSALCFAKLLVMIDNKRNLTTVVFGILSFRFLFTLFYFGIYFLIVKPEGKFFVVPFMLMFAYYLIVENVYLLKYADYVYKKAQANN